MNNRTLLPLICSLSLLVAPIIGCQPESDQSETHQSETHQSETHRADSHQVKSHRAESVAVVAVPATTLKIDTDSAQVAADLGPADSTWDLVQSTTSDGFTIVSSGIASGTGAVRDCSSAAWVWSADRSADGWQWIRDNAGDAAEWASDTLHQTWTMTESATGEFCLWVQVQAADGVGWVRTQVPAAWQVVKDEAGRAWIWVGDHQVEVGVFAAVVTVVVAGLIVAPEAVGPAVVKGASAGAARQTTVFVAELWEQRDTDQNVAQQLKNVSQSAFMSIGQAVLVQCGSEVLAAQ